MNTHNLKLSFRNLQRNKLYSFLSILGFSVGFAVSMITALFLYSEFTMDQSLPASDRIVRVVDTRNNCCNLDYKLNEEFRENFPAIETACPAEIQTGWDIKVKSEKSFTRFQGMISTTNDFFRLFPVKIIRSASPLPFTGTESVILTQSVAKILFADEDPIGKPLTITEELQARVSAVIEDFPAGSSIQGKILINSENEKFRLSQTCNNNVCINPTNHFLLLKNGADLQGLQHSFNLRLLKSHPEIGKFGFQKLGDIYLSPALEGSNIVPGNKSLLWIFLSVGLVVLILSIINFLNFYISMQYSKLREIGIKKINGASYGQLLSYSLLEVTINILISVAFSLILTAVLLPVFNQLFDKQLEISSLLRPRLALILFGVLLLIILLNSFAPVWVLNKFNSLNFLGTMKSGRSRQTGSKLLTLVQFTASMVLITLVLALYHQISFTRDAYLGFDKQDLIRLNLPYTFKNSDALKQQIERLPFCRNIALSSGVPGEINMEMGEFVNKKEILIKCIDADSNFLKTMGIRLKSGRSFLEGEAGNAVLFNEEAIRQYGWTDLTDKRFNQGRKGGYPVVGIMENFHVESLHTKIGPVCVIFKDMRHEANSVNVTIRLTGGDLRNKMQQLEKVWKSFFPDEPMDYTFYDDQFNAMYKKDEQLSKVIGIVALLALILTFMGMLGQSFQMSLNRTKEIGIRKVNGATVFEILLSMNREYMVWMLPAMLLEIPIAYYFIQKWLANFAYKTQVNAWIFAISACIVFVTVTITVSLQSWKTANRNPVDALRYE